MYGAFIIPITWNMHAIQCSNWKSGPFWVAWHGFECGFQWLVTMIFFPEIYNPPPHTQERYVECNLCSEQHLHNVSGNRPMSLVLQWYLLCPQLRYKGEFHGFVKPPMLVIFVGRKQFIASRTLQTQMRRTSVNCMPRWHNKCVTVQDGNSTYHAAHMTLLVARCSVADHAVGDGSTCSVQPNDL